MDTVTLIRVIAGLLFLGILAVGVSYIAYLGNVLSRCAPMSRTMGPGSVWFLLVPVFNLVWSFIVVNALADTLANEFRLRNLPSPELKPGRSIGIAMATCGAVSIIPFVNFLAIPAHLVLWIVYWVKISGYAGQLNVAQPPITVAQI